MIKAFDNEHRNARIRLYRVVGIEDLTKREAYLKELGVKDESLKTIIPQSQKLRERLEKIIHEEEETQKRRC